MGNQPSSGNDGVNNGSAGANKLKGFMRTTGLLGLSKAELDDRCRPSGLYPSCQWEDKAIRKLIGDGKLAARLRGTENRASPTDRECPICFLQYRELNSTKCCSAFICTECYLQVRPQKAKSPSCPFCNHSRFSVTVAQAMNAEAMLLREETEQRVIEAKIRERATQQHHQQPGNNNPSDSSPQPTGFGSSLEQHERIATLRARSSSLSDHENTLCEEVLRSSFAMTPEERRILEDEMRAQHSHPLSLRLQAEAEERRIQNEREFLRNNPSHAFLESNRAARQRNSSSSRNIGGPPRRNWNQIVEAFERGGHGEVNSLDDLVVLEAAMILSMEEESRRRSSGNNAAAMGPGVAGEADAGEDAEHFDANRHATEGFPLVRSILAGRPSGARGGGTGIIEDSNEQLQSLANSLYSSRRWTGRNSLLRAAYGAGNENGNLNTAMDTAGLLMRGISEDDQIAMAIAASLQEHQQASQEQQEEGEVRDEERGDENEEAATAEAEVTEGTNEGGGAGEPVEEATATQMDAETDAALVDSAGAMASLTMTQAIASTSEPSAISLSAEYRREDEV